MAEPADKKQTRKFLRPLHRKTSYRHRGTEEQKQRIIDKLQLPTRLVKGLLDELHAETNVPIGTLKDWRTKLRKGINPFKRKPHPARSLPKDVEDEIYERIISRIKQRKYTPRAYLRKIAQDLGKPVRPCFQAGRRWMVNFLMRYKLSLRVPHFRRRTEPDDDIVSAFLADFEVAKMQLPRQLILNMDETAWRLSNGIVKTIHRRGADDVCVETQLDEKTCLTVICCVTASGRKLPPWIICKGKTARCEKRYRDSLKLRRYITSGKLIITHTESGWATGDLMQKYIDWVSDQVGGRICYLLWDLHSSHREIAVKMNAEARLVNLSYIPAGQTGEWQPLDKRLFGHLKAVAQSELDRISVDQDFGTLDMVDALVMLVEEWSRLKVEDVKAAWDHLFIIDPEDAIEEDPNDEATSIAEPVNSDDSDEEGDDFEEFVEHSEELPSEEYSEHE